MTSSAVTTLSHDSGRRASIAIALATSPASCPPMPSATKNADGDARYESSLSLRRAPRWDDAPHRTDTGASSLTTSPHPKGGGGR